MHQTVLMTVAYTMALAILVLTRQNMVALGPWYSAIWFFLWRISAFSLIFFANNYAIFLPTEVRSRESRNLSSEEVLVTAGGALSLLIYIRFTFII